MRVLRIVSSLTEMGNSGKQTGTWFTELADPDLILSEAGFALVFASSIGGAAPIGPFNVKTPFTTEPTARS
jgi:hypothetical protein